MKCVAVLRILLALPILLLSGSAARAQSPGPSEETPPKSEDRVATSTDRSVGAIAPQKDDMLEPGADAQNQVGWPLIQHLVADQRMFWTTPARLKKADLKWALPFAGFAGAFIASDSWLSKQVPNKPNQLKRSQDLSNYMLYSTVGVAGGSYLWGLATKNDHLRETGFLATEAVANGTAVTYAFKTVTQRERPQEGNRQGQFFVGGSSFPSEHAAVAWSIAGVVVHEYPSTLTKLLAYGLASGVTLTRVTGQQHFPSDVVVGSALGWYMGRQVYRAHHDPELGGEPWGGLLDDSEKPPRSPQNMGSPFVPLDSWVYPALERLAALGYVDSAFAGLKPWTRIECVQLTEQAGDFLQGEEGAKNDLVALHARLHQEFAYEFGLLEGNRNATASVESVYTRAVSVSGPALTDSYHFGQTFAYDFGRPFRTGTNAQTGASFRASLGPAAFFARAEFQHAPSAPPLSASVRDFIATADLVPLPPATSFAPVNRVRLLDAYAAVNLAEGWQLSFGKESLSWSAGPGGSLLWSNNAEPITMVRLLQTNGHLPAFLKFLGPVRIDSFFGRVDGHTYIPHPYIYGNKIDLKPFRNLEIGLGRTVMIGGRGGDPLTTRNFLLSFFGQVGSKDSVPGDSHSSFDWTFYVPKVHNYLVFYGEWYSDDDFVPLQTPGRSPFRPGIYIPKFPHLPKLDLHVEATSTETPGYPNNGKLNYWNITYHDGYTNNGNLVGNTVGRMGRTIQSWLTYWISPRSTLQVTYKHNSISKDFVPQGAAWQDYAVRHETYLASGLYVKSQVQYENISSFPLLFSGPKHNVTAVIEVGLFPHKAK